MAIEQKKVRMFNGLPLVDAEHELSILVRAEDIRKAYENNKGRPANDPMRFSTCGIAEGCKTLLGSKHVAIQRSTAYIEHAGDDGVVRAYRYLFTQSAEDFVRKFDNEALPVNDTMVRLRPPSPGKTLEHQNKRDKELREKKAKGTYKPNPKRSKAQRKSHTKPQAILDVRHGGGHIQQTVVTAA